MEQSIPTAVASTDQMGRFPAIVHRYLLPFLWHRAFTAPGTRARSSAGKTHSRMDSRTNFPGLLCRNDSDCGRRLFTGKKETAHGGDKLRTHDFADDVLGLPADASRYAQRCGDSELLLRYTAVLRHDPAVGERDGELNSRGVSRAQSHRRSRATLSRGLAKLNT